MGTCSNSLKPFPVLPDSSLSCCSPARAGDTPFQATKTASQLQVTNSAAASDEFRRAKATRFARRSKQPVWPGFERRSACFQPDGCARFGAESALVVRFELQSSSRFLTRVRPDYFWPGFSCLTDQVHKALSNVLRETPAAFANRRHSGKY